MRVTDAVIDLSVLLNDAGFSFSDYRADTGSYYFSTCGFQIRVSNHAGHALKRNEFSIRTDAQTKSKGRIYSAKDIKMLVSVLIKKTKEQQQ